MVLSAHAVAAGLRVQMRKKQLHKKRSLYENDPASWIEKRAQGFLYDKIREIAQSLADNRKTAVQSCHAAGKSWLCARLVGWWLDTSAPGEAFVVTTAPTAKQVKAVLWKEIRRVYNVARMDGRVNQTEWWMNGEMVAMGRKPSDYDPTAFQGIHARKVLVLLDEACGVVESIYVAANSLAANEFSRILAVGNPDDPDTYFGKICQPGSGWNTISVSAFDTPNFTGIDCPQAVKDTLTSPIYEEEVRLEFGVDSPIYQSKILGKFPENASDGVVPYGWVERCKDFDAIEGYTEEDLLPIELGIDVGGGRDLTTVRERRGILVGREWSAQTPEPEDAYELCMKAIIESGASRAKIDIIGIGWGLIGMLRQAFARGEHTCEIVPVNVGVGSTDPVRFPRFRDQLWWEVGRELTKDKVWNLALLDDKTISESCMPRWKPDLANRIKVEAKEETRTRLDGRSPDHADALLLAFCNPPDEDKHAVLVYEEPLEIGPTV